ncbi:DinB family protein [Sporosarcina sp. Marseille-Q4063]|uniref:DinB family protein n=1 Tax=Sporosarcina sp. Marseille-Q4063 TaxID=2810514 RepID=UPI001BB0962F|nr:DinB family protein [Sporosarcina sp. Marseille-Q4063]QUW23583.1 DinB family protein [Sporosarcina sp. Marseille-Q4063]
MNNTLNQFEQTVDQILRLNDVQAYLLLEPINLGKWSIREIVGHLYYWDKFNLEKMVPKMVDGGNLPPFPNHDRHNEEAISYLKDQSVASIINDFVNTRKELITGISEIGDDVRFTIGKGKRKFSGESFIKIFVKHDIHHIQQINKKLSN